MEKLIQPLLILSLSIFLIQCGSTTHISSGGTIETHQLEFQYSDSTIAKAFEMMPQIQAPIKVAIYDSGHDIFHIAEEVESIPGVRSATYITPSLMGRSNASIAERRFYGYQQVNRKIQPIELRTFAAQSHSDLILYIETNHEVRAGANALALSYAGLLPMFFVPGNNLEVTSTIDFYLIDVRNGFIYSSFRNRANAQKRFVKINYSRHADELVGKNSELLIQSVLIELERTLKNEQYFAGDLKGKSER